VWIVFGARVPESRYMVLQIFLIGLDRVKVSTNRDVCPSVTLGGQNCNFSRYPRENLFNSVPDNDARMLALCKLRLAEKRMTEATYKPTLRPETSLSDLERALSGDFVSIQDMDLSCPLDLTPLNNKFLVLLAQESKTLGYGVGLRK
jgi:hypothetical protein